MVKIQIVNQADIQTAMADCVWMRDGEGDVRKGINQDIPQAGSHHAMSWKYGVLAQPETFGGWIWGGGCIDRVSSLTLLASETPGKTNFDDVNSEFATVSQKIRPSLL